MTEEKKPVQNLFLPDTVFTFTLQEVALIEQQIQWMQAIINNAKNLAASQGATVAAFKEDYELDEKGDFKADEKGFPILKPNFFDKFKKEAKSVNLVEELKKK